MADEKTFKGSCHCGKVSYEVKMAPPTKGVMCNCSICSRMGWVLGFVPGSAFTLKSGEDVLKDYQFGKHHLHHKFCTNCGIRSFSQGTAKDGTPTYALNLRCIEGVDVGALEIQHYDGRSA